MLEVARAAGEVGIEAVADEQRVALNAQGGAEFGHCAGARLEGHIGGGDGDAAFGGSLGEHGADREAAHALGQALSVGAGMRAVRDCAADAGGRGGAAQAGASAAFLAARLGVGLAHIGAVQRVVVALPPVGLVREDGLVDDAEVGLDAEHAVGGVNFADLLACRVEYGEFHRFFPPRRLVCRMRTAPLVAPGTEPLT